MFDIHWREVLRVVSGTTVETYMSEFMFRQVDSVICCSHSFDNNIETYVEPTQKHPAEDIYIVCCRVVKQHRVCIYPALNDFVTPHPPTYYCGRKREKWAFCFNPGALTLGITSTQRVEGMNAVLKHLISRYSSLPRLDTALETVEAKLHLESERYFRRVA